MERDDYGRMRLIVLRARAAAGDRAAVQELARRGEPVTRDVDVTTTDDVTLRALVRAWRDGHTAEERRQHRALADAAHRELVARFRVDERLGTPTGRRPIDPGTPPWEVPPPPRSTPWQRPRTSTCYPNP